MKTKLLVSSLLMTGALMASGMASAAPLEWSWTGTGWNTAGATIVDNGANYLGGTTTGNGSGDTTFTFSSNTIGNGGAFEIPTVTLKEEHINGADLYNVGLGWIGSQTTGSFAYTIATTDTTGFNLAALDSIISGATGDVTKKIYTDSGMSNLLLTLDSNNGSSTAFSSFPAYQSLYVVDTIVSGSVSNINDIHNQFTSSVPEPMTLVMLGVGLVGLGYSRRNTLFGAKGLSA